MSTKQSPQKLDYAKILKSFEVEGANEASTANAKTQQPRRQKLAIGHDAQAVGQSLQRHDTLQHLWRSI